MKRGMGRNAFNIYLTSFVCVFVCVCVQNGLTPLHLVAQEGHVGIADMLVKQGASVYAASRVRHFNAHTHTQQCHL